MSVTVLQFFVVWAGMVAIVAGLSSLLLHNLMAWDASRAHDEREGWLTRDEHGVWRETGARPGVDLLDD